ncbi:MAG TPA: hypothetical protein DCE44_13925 [Verrucomicrobiales bacterium]|nr:hypothetical protein [Verrucomicrobiales bacterium]
MPSLADAELLERETDRLVAEREEQAAETDRRREEETRASGEATTKKNRDDSLWIVQSSASDIAGFDEQIGWLRAVLRNWNERNRKFMNVTATDIAFFILLMASPLAVVTLDMLMLSYVGREIARGAIESVKGVGGSGIGWIVLVAVVLFTLGYVVVELVIGAGRDNEHLSRELRRRSAQLSVMLWITLPLFIVIFSLISSGMFSADPAKTMGRASLTAAIARAALFGLFALAFHGFILWFGCAVVNAYGYGAFKARQVDITRRIRNLERRRRKASGDLESSFRDFHGAVTSAGSSSQGKVGPFGATTIRVTNATFATEVIEPPEPDQRQRPSTANATGSNGQRSQPIDTEDTPHAGPSAENSNANEPSQAQQNGSGSNNEWPGTVYDMSDEDEVR